MKLKIWIDDIRPSPKGFIWLHSVNEAKRFLSDPHICSSYQIELIDMDHDAGFTHLSAEITSSFLIGSKEPEGAIR